MISFHNIKGLSNNLDMARAEVYNSVGWREFQGAINKFYWHPERCGFLDLKDCVDGLCIERVTYNATEIRIVVSIQYTKDSNEPRWDYCETINLDFTEKELNTRAGMRRWIRTRNLQTQKKRKKEDMTTLNKLLRQYKEEPKIQALMTKILTMNR